MLLDETVSPSRAFQRLITRCEKQFSDVFLAPWFAQFSQVKSSKFATCSKNSLLHLQQYDEKRCVYLERIGRHSLKSQQKRDHACAAWNCLDLHNLRK